jgi:hypothetical protein
MARDVDTYLVQTSAGDATVQYGWNRWISVSGRGLTPRRAVVGNRRGLERLLADAGIPPNEARVHARKLWSDRPSGSLRRGEAEAWEGPWKQHPYGTLVGFVVAVVIVVVVIVILKFDWVAI